MTASSPQTRRVVVIGAGIGGIAAVRTYLRLWRAVHAASDSSLDNHSGDAKDSAATATTSPPSSDSLRSNLEITVIDAHRSPGGVWARERIYPGLYAHAPTGLFEFGDSSMVDEGVDGKQRYKPLSGQRVSEYLEAEAERWGFWEAREGREGGVGPGKGYNGEWRRNEGGEMVRGRFAERVMRVRRKGGVGKDAMGWFVTTRREAALGAGEEFHYECDKLLVATGCYNRPRLPMVLQAGFDGVSIHSSAMGQQFERLTTDPKIKHIMVVGGAKSAVEACNLFLPHMHPDKSRGRFCVTWVVRPGPKGVNFMLVDLADPDGTADKTQTRVASLPWASNWDTESWWYYFLHSGKSVMGTWLMAIFWFLLDWGIKRAANYDKSENARRLKPGTGRGLEYDLNSVAQLPPHHEAITELHKDDMEVFQTRRAEVRELKGNSAMLVDANGEKETLPCDAVIWCTGWWPSIEFFDEKEAQRLGIPVALEKGTEKIDDENTGGLSMTRSAEESIEKLFSRLRTRRRPLDPCPKHTAYTLFRHVVSPWSMANQDRSVAFVDMTANANTVVGAIMSALWATAWCEEMINPTGLLKLDAQRGGPSSYSEVLEAAQWQTAVQNAFTRLRWGQRWSREPEVLLETQAYTDRLCRDLGLRVRRKRRSSENGMSQRYRDWKREWFTPYRAADYNDIVEEFVASWNSRGKSTEDA